MVVPLVSSNLYHASKPVRTQLPDPQVPPVQGVPSARLTCWQPSVALQESVVHVLASSQLMTVPAQLPPLHTSPVVQTVPSSQLSALLTVWQPRLTSQKSVVQTLPSLQVTLLPVQTPPAQVSPVVHAEPSLQLLVLLAKTQPLLALQLSVVQALPSVQVMLLPLTHEPPEHASPTVQTLPSSQGWVLLLWTQPVPVLQLSAVHSLPSSQLGALPGTQLPLAQMSMTVHALPSVQKLLLLVKVQPLVVSQASVVHGLPSLQATALPLAQLPPVQVSPLVQALPSVHGKLLLALTQPLAELHESLVHSLPSSQLGALPGTQLPPAQVSESVHALPSLQEALLLPKTQPLVVLQLSVVQGLLSLQVMAVPAPQLPPLQVSLLVHALPSLQGALLLLCWQPTSGSHRSFVQPLPSSQLRTLPPLHTPPLQASLEVQLFPSLQLAVLLA